MRLRAPCLIAHPSVRFRPSAHTFVLDPHTLTYHQ
jgi:hypothetical protein